jgi:hypothetical protein
MKMLFNRPVNAIPATAIRLLAENRRTTGAASPIASTWLDFNGRKRNAAKGTSAPGQNAEVRRWRASPKRWTIPNGPELAHARFLIHGISTQLQAGGTFDEKGFEELLKVLNSDYKNVAGVISEATTKSVDQIVADMNTRITLNASEAKEYGLVHEIKPELFAIGSSLTVIYEDCSIREVLPSAFQPPLPLNPMPPISAPIVQGTTLNVSPMTGTFFPEGPPPRESGVIWNVADWTKQQAPIGS